MRDRQLLWPVLALLTAACGSSEAERAAEPPAEEPRRESVFDAMTSPIGRAEGVQQTLDAQAAEQRRRLEQAER